MDIFVKTSNKSKDYKWFNAENSEIQSPNISNPNQLEKLVDTEFESLVLYRESSQLILAITALKSGRIDNRTRPIRNSLIWIADNDEEAKIRAIIYESLTDKKGLEDKIAEAITETPEIKINHPKIESIGEHNNIENNPLDSSKLICKIGNLDKCKQDLITDIQSYNLPTEKGLLIFITDSKSQKNFEEAKPWRGLSNNISSGGWIILGDEKLVVNEKKTKKQISQISTKSLTDSEKSLTKSNKTERKLLNIFSIILVLLLVSNAFLLYQVNELKQENHKQQTEINNLKQNIKKIEDLQEEIKKSKAEVKKLKTDLETNIRNANSKFEEAQKQFEEARKRFMEAQKQFNENIFNATSEYETEMAKVQKRLSDSIEKITNTNSPSDEGEVISTSG